MQERETKKSPRAPDWDRYLNDENYHDFVTYAKGAKMIPIIPDRFFDIMITSGETVLIENRIW